jgi:probable addiction module antidote protein
MDRIEEASLSCDELIDKLSRDRAFTAAYVATAMNDVSEPVRRAAGLVALRTVAEAYGGLGAVAKAGQVSRASVYRALSANGNPRLTTLIELLRTVGLRLSIEVEASGAPDLERPVRGRPKGRCAAHGGA